MLTTTKGTRRLRISARFQSQLDGGHLFQCPDEIDRHGYGEEGQALVAAVAAARPNKEGARFVDATPEQVQILRELAETWESGAADNLGAWDDGRDALADLNAARGFLRQLGDR